MMLVSRVLGRVLCAASKSESFATSAAAAAADSARKAQNPLEEFFEVDRSTDEEKPVVYGIVRKSMCRIKHVLTERAIADPDPRRSAEMKRMINAL
ncbi:hypothetical protein BHE74_00010496 [Ensete ventricosum]|uniref:Uncharacterized protein n=1 Tax=Ensete ventricosum TaxID=4639 RepID=A0A444GB55_ENSVE|nr:hypothetical protein B296_00002569 [Ensete ventricosum]RWW32091.1 hypothetical protein GW17_00003258 [Ensete ventricosum]RWW81142.1 hypothetical protein BHE74_00010496 [Ensete ventricosum]RZR89430.1 hypothetical protein BHM03_00017166 [Ensete ventricosum]